MAALAALTPTETTSTVTAQPERTAAVRPTIAQLHRRITNEHGHKGIVTGSLIYSWHLLPLVWVMKEVYTAEAAAGEAEVCWHLYVHVYWSGDGVCFASSAQIQQQHEE